MGELEQIFDTRTVLAEAIARLTARHNCSSDEARERVQQEAMAKRATLDEVARAIVAGQTVSYHPNALSLGKTVR